ncbi:replication-relaxation family protein [Curtobacterium sp. GD1]|uniref:replication-relaxation family protein n=1 Tax=Curtobacterium sp. GD1 TaxID=2810612 RepID=UPI001E442E90|nr:replication-relaxation family protein [Curtobacterium sp. GD1]MCC8907747.1 replication-relaxation family protein [Curtobacterium sp. GD1]
MSGSSRRSTADAVRLLSRLSERDIAVLRRISEHRFLTTNHVRRLEFHDHASVDAGTRACTRVLTRLVRLRLIYRLDRQIGGVRGGSGAFVWSVDDAGDRVLRAALNVEQGKRRRAYEPSWLFLAHTLAIAETRVSLHEAALAGRYDLLEVRTEPRNWRPFLGPLGTAQTLKPDLEAVTASGEYEDHFFLEIDRGTESLPVVTAKCLVYEQYRATGKEQAASGVFPVVVWLIADAARREALKEALARHARIDERLFEVLDPGELIGFVSGDGPPLITNGEPASG